MIPLKNKLIAEFFGTFWLVFGGCGSAVLAAMFLTTGDSPVQLGIGFVGVSLAFGLTVLTMAYAIGTPLMKPVAVEDDYSRQLSSK